MENNGDCPICGRKHHPGTRVGFSQMNRRCFQKAEVRRRRQLQKYAPTHRSRFDGSDAMFVGMDDTDDGITIGVFRNENGDEWPDPVDDWDMLR